MPDTILHNGTILTVNEAFSVLEQAAVAIANGKIDKVWVPSDGEPMPDAGQRIDLQGNLVMPGLVNAHTHLPMSLFRGLADDLPLELWLNEHIFPAEGQHIKAHTVRAGARLACAEMLLGGTTTCCDGYFLVEHFFEAVSDAGLRAILGQGIIDYPAPGVPDPERNIDAARTFVQNHRSRSKRMQPSLFCHSPYTCSPQTLTRAKQAADQSGVLFQIHVAETRAERDQIQKEQGCSPIQYLHGLGILDPNTLLVHAVWLDPDDIDTVARSGARMVHCPESNMKLASGVAPVPDCLRKGITVGLGTDGCASNNDLDLWGEMDSAAKLHKVHRHDPTVMDARTVVRMATIEGAKSLGLDHQVGSIEPGKAADLIVLNPHTPHLIPMYHPASHIVYAARASDVCHVMVAGEWVVWDRQVLTMHLEDVMHTVNQIRRRITSA